VVFEDRDIARVGGRVLVPIEIMQTPALANAGRATRSIRAILIII